MDFLKNILFVISLLGLIPIFKNYLDLKILNRKSDLDEYERFKKLKKDWGDNIMTFEQEVLLKSVGFLRNLSWYEFEFLFVRNVDLRTLKSFNFLVGKGLIRFNVLDKKFEVKNYRGIDRYFSLMDFYDLFQILILCFWIFYVFYDLLSKNTDFSKVDFLNLISLILMISLYLAISFSWLKYKLDMMKQNIERVNNSRVYNIH